MKHTTLCYLEQNDCYLMLHRVKKENDANKDKWIGVGGKLEPGESPEECVCREVWEETGLTLTHYAYRGFITFVSDEWGTEYMHLFTATGFCGQMHGCSEGELEWVPKARVSSLPLWEGDHIFLRLLQRSTGFFSLKLVYTGAHLQSAVLNGALLPKEQWRTL
jgi:8-oxo-dGTP diphosphatase